MSKSSKWNQAVQCQILGTVNQLEDHLTLFRDETLAGLAKIREGLRQGGSASPSVSTSSMGEGSGDEGDPLVNMETQNDDDKQTVPSSTRKSPSDIPVLIMRLPDAKVEEEVSEFMEIEEGLNMDGDGQAGNGGRVEMEVVGDNQPAHDQACTSGAGGTLIQTMWKIKSDGTQNKMSQHVLVVTLKALNARQANIRFEPDSFQEIVQDEKLATQAARSTHEPVKTREAQLTIGPGFQECMEAQMVQDERALAVTKEQELIATQTIQEGLMPQSTDRTMKGQEVDLSQELENAKALAASREQELTKALEENERLTRKTQAAMKKIEQITARESKLAEELMSTEVLASYLEQDLMIAQKALQEQELAAGRERERMKTQEDLLIQEINELQALAAGLKQDNKVLTDEVCKLQSKHKIPYVKLFKLELGQKYEENKNNTSAAEDRLSALNRTKFTEDKGTQTNVVIPNPMVTERGKENDHEENQVIVQSKPSEEQQAEVERIHSSVGTSTSFVDLKRKREHDTASQEEESANKRRSGAVDVTEDMPIILNYFSASSDEKFWLEQNNSSDDDMAGAIASASTVCLGGVDRDTLVDPSGTWTDDVNAEEPTVTLSCSAQMSSTTDIPNLPDEKVAVQQQDQMETEEVNKEAAHGEGGHVEEVVGGDNNQPQPDAAHGEGGHVEDEVDGDNNQPQPNAAQMNQAEAQGAEDHEVTLCCECCSKIFKHERGFKAHLKQMEAMEKMMYDCSQRKRKSNHSK